VFGHEGITSPDTLVHGLLEPRHSLCRLRVTASIWPLVGHFCSSPDGRQINERRISSVWANSGLMHRRKCGLFEHLVGERRG